MPTEPADRAEMGDSDPASAGAASDTASGTRSGARPHDTQPRRVESPTTPHDARFRRPPPGKPDLLPEEPPRTLDDTPISTGLPRSVTVSPARVPVGEGALWRTVMIAAFVLPVLIIFGLFGLVIALTGEDDPAAPAEVLPPVTESALTTTPEPTRTAEGAWPAGLAFSPHTIPALIKDRITAPGGLMGYSFTGQAGQQWAVTVEARDSVFDPQVTMYAPSGELLAFNDNRAPGATAADLHVTLPDSGTYRFVVESSAESSSTGAYLFALFPR